MSDTLTPLLRRGLEKNIWKFTLLQISNKRIFVAILSVYFLSVPGVTVWWVGAFLVIGNISNFVFDIPSSYIGDKIGHKQALVLARAFAFASTLTFVLANSIALLALASVLMSAAFAFQSGVGTAFMHETLRQLNREGEYRKIMGRSSSIGFAIPAVLMALVPLTASISFKVPFLIALCTDFFGLMVSFSLTRPTIQSEHKEEIKGTTMLQVIRQGLLLRYFRIAVFSGVVSALLDGIDGFRGPYQLSLGVPVVLFGIFFGTGRALASIMLAFSDKIHKWIGDVYAYQRLQIVIYSGLLFAIALFATPTVAVVVLIFDNALQWGLSQVDTGYMLDIIRDNKFKATLLSIGNQIENVLSIVIVLIMGTAIQFFGYRTSFLVLAGVFLLVLLAIHYYIVKNRKAVA